MARTLVGSFDTFEHASAVVEALAAQGVARRDVSLVANDAAGRLAAGGDTGASAGPAGDAVLPRPRSADALSESGADDSAVAGAGTGAFAGGVLGGTAGLIAGLASLAVPGVGPLMVVGPIVAALTGAGIGALAGGLIGGLRQIGVPDAEAEYYAESVRRGGALVVVRADDAEADAIARTLRLHGAIDIASRAAAWREASWTGFDARAQPYTPAEIEAERVRYRDRATGSVRETRASDHPNLGVAPERPGRDVREGESGGTERPAGAASEDDLR